MRHRKDLPTNTVADQDSCRHRSSLISTAISDAPELLTPKQAACYLGISIPTLYRALRSGRLTGSKIGGQWRISSETLQKFVEDGIHIPTTSNSEQ